MTSSIINQPTDPAASLTSRFDVGIDPGPIDATYTPTPDMLATIDAIAALDDIAFRFWAAKTVFMNLSSVFPCDDAEEVVTFVVNEAIENGGPTDGHYQLILDSAGYIEGVRYEDDAPNLPCEYDRLIFEIVRQPAASDRRTGLIELATLSALTEQNANLERGLEECRYWAAANPQSSATQS